MRRPHNVQVGSESVINWPPGPGSGSGSGSESHIYESGTLTEI
jgi:hypothetical protein